MTKLFACTGAVILILLLSHAAPPASAQEKPALPRIVPPPAGRLYHGVFPGDTGLEDELPSFDDLDGYENAVGKKVAWVYFSHFWYRGKRFPLQEAKQIRSRGAVPYIRLMLRSSDEQNVQDPAYKLQKILSGKYDKPLRRWFKAAAKFGTPLLVEWGTECNGEWFPWNGWWNGRGNTGGFGDPKLPDGPERFVAVYRRLVQFSRDQGASNIVWVFHVNDSDWPDKAWNRLENYYPGDGYTDWIALSAYGPQTPMDTWVDLFRDMADECYARIRKMAPDKPVFVAEFGCTHTGKASRKDERMRADRWAGDALADFFAGRWPAVIGFSWWNEHWRNDNNPAHDTNMRVQDYQPLADAFRTSLADNSAKLQTEPVIQ
jgi:hypothetical protein